MKKISNLNLLMVLMFVSILMSCEEEFIPKIDTSPPDFVVEGYIEGGDSPTSPYVILTRSIPFFSEIDLNQVDGFFVHDAEVTVSVDTETITLHEFCLNELSLAQRVVVSELFGLSTDAEGIDFCVYIDPTFSLGGEQGKRYDLNIEVEGKTITASTTIPFISDLSNYQFDDVPGVPNDTLRELRVTLADRGGEANFYRYFTDVNEAGMLAPPQSVLNDLFFDGDRFEFPLAKAEEGDVDFNLDSYGFYTVGDTVDIKFCTIDEAHYDFWSTLEFNRVNQGPFSSYTAISYNINGGIGIWGAYSSSIERLIVE